MAYVEVEHEEVSFAKLKDIGDKFEGYYLKDEPGNFNKQDFHFRKPDGSAAVVSAGGSLKAQLDKSALSLGFKVFIKLTHQEPTSHANPKNVFKVFVDKAPGPMPKAAKVTPPSATQTQEDPF